ncbi:DNase I-like protein [Pluteus cervinus]|uniref:DNase I-like protein n=1 Tax=Pluteus cervinus TaxID=181527 RepID=A0ACD3A0E2_9AGAR|nr:DNase I-like protein [Pluteus cervinus]
MMRTNNIGILAIQETHLTQELVDTLHETFQKSLVIKWSSDPNNTNSKGVAIILNKGLTRWNETEEIELVKGRAMMMTIKWHQEKKLHVLCVYAPNDPNENGDFWKKIDQELREKNLPSPDVMLGDFNMVEDSIDRLKTRNDPVYCTEALRELKRTHHLADGWRRTNGGDKGYTFYQKATKAHSRIDRIYVAENRLASTYEWEIEEAPIQTDHKVVKMTICDPDTPYIGPGRWTLPLPLLKEKELVKKLYEIGMEAQGEMERVKMNRTDERNPQTVLRNFKTSVQECVKGYNKQKMKKINGAIEKLKKDLEDTINDETQDEDRRKEAAAETD